MLACARRLTALACLVVAFAAHTQGNAPAAFDAELAKSVGADEHGMRKYVIVVLKTGARRVPDGPERDAMFRGHFANIERLARAGKLVVAGPLDGVDGWRGLFVLAGEPDEARRLVADDPVVVQGEMTPEFHVFHGSAALMLVPAAHERIAPRQP